MSEKVTREEESQIGRVGVWCSSLEEKSVGVIIGESTLQLYKQTRYGTIPRGLPEDINGWTCEEEITNFYYIEKNGVILLRFD